MEEVTYTIKEISMATGMPVQTLRGHYYKLRDAGAMPGGLKAFTYAQARQLLHKQARGKKPRPELVTALKRQLQNDGYTIKKD